ncbi:glycosyltransferase [uncultured Clostridium sp.]|uniref:glycosyltransferase family 2 protein n=1 Tax=uncultured Clostridium sp. TaxID=59620 RepID=UPI002583DCCA|nr:glycosyltransferase [uncultured Clostridium sp.]
MSNIVSVVVPFYNVEKYICRCLESIINQTFNDIEIILINDGSTDFSYEKIQKYIDSDNRIIYLEHENIGLGETRNRGIDIASGKYIAFIDSDDYIENDMIECLLKKIEEKNFDVVCCETYIDNGSRNKKVRKSFINIEDYIPNFNKLEFLEKYYFNGNYSHNAWDKLYNLEFIRENNIRFGDNKKIFSEDNFFQIQILNCNPKIGYINKALYNYVIRDNSIMNSYKENLIERHLNMFDELIENVYKGNLENSDKYMIALLIFDVIIMHTKNILNEENNKHLFIDGIKKLKDSTIYEIYIDSILKNNALDLEKILKRKKFIQIASFLINNNLYYLAWKMFYIKYKFF